MLEGGVNHTKIFREILERMENNYNFKENPSVECWSLYLLCKVCLS